MVAWRGDWPQPTKEDEYPAKTAKIVDRISLKKQEFMSVHCGGSPRKRIRNTTPHELTADYFVDGLFKKRRMQFAEARDEAYPQYTQRELTADYSIDGLFKKRVCNLRKLAEEAFERSSEHIQVRSAISQLSHDEQQLLTLRYYAELSVPEVASTLGWPEGTVKSRLHRALRAMRELLEPRDQEAAR